MPDDNVIDLGAARAQREHEDLHHAYADGKAFRFEILSYDEVMVVTPPDGSHVVIHRCGTLDGTGFSPEDAERIGLELIQSAVEARLAQRGVDLSPAYADDDGDAAPDPAPKPE